MVRVTCCLHKYLSLPKFIVTSKVKKYMCVCMNMSKFLAFKKSIYPYLFTRLSSFSRAH